MRRVLLLLPLAHHEEEGVTTVLLLLPLEHHEEEDVTRGLLLLPLAHQGALLLPLGHNEGWGMTNDAVAVAPGTNWRMGCEKECCCPVTHEGGEFCC